jgi:hypothetical protein
MNFTTKPPIQGNRYAQDPAGAPKNPNPPVQAMKPGISPGVAALMQRGRPDPNSGQNLPLSLATLHAEGARGAPGAQMVRPMQQFQGAPKPMPMQAATEGMPGAPKVDPNMQRRLMAFRGGSR